MFLPCYIIPTNALHRGLRFYPHDNPFYPFLSQKRGGGRNWQQSFSFSRIELPLCTNCTGYKFHHPFSPLQAVSAHVYTEISVEFSSAVASKSPAQHTNSSCIFQSSDLEINRNSSEASARQFWEHKKIKGERERETSKANN